MSKKLWMYVKGDIPRPSASDSSLSDWLSNAYAAAGLILLSLEDSQHTHVADMEDDPVLMWKTLVLVVLSQLCAWCLVVMVT